MKTLRRAFLLCVVLAATWLAVYVLGAEPRTLALETAQVANGSVIKVITATGVIQPQVGAIVKIGSIATGMITDMRVKIGDPVKTGQLVALIDDRELQSRKAEAQSQLAALEAELEYARLTLGRQGRLRSSRVINQSDFDEIHANVKRLEAKAEAQRDTIAALDVRISHTRIQSPIDGVVGAITAQQGETILAGLEVVNLVTVVDPTRLDMRVFVDETDIGKVQPGSPVQFEVDAYQGRKFASKISYINPFPEIRNNVVYYHASVMLDPKLAVLLRPEMTAKCEVLLAAKHGVVTIPKNAIKWEHGESVVYAVGKDGQASPITPRVGLSGRESIQVLGGLALGDVVATRVGVETKAEAYAARFEGLLARIRAWLPDGGQKRWPPGESGNASGPAS